MVKEFVWMNPFNGIPIENLEKLFRSSCQAQSFNRFNQAIHHRTLESFSSLHVDFSGFLRSPSWCDSSKVHLRKKRRKKTVLETSHRRRWVSVEHFISSLANMKVNHRPDNREEWANKVWDIHDNCYEMLLVAIIIIFNFNHDNSQAHPIFLKLTMAVNHGDEEKETCPIKNFPTQKQM